MRARIFNSTASPKLEIANSVLLTLLDSLNSSCELTANTIIDNSSHSVSLFWLFRICTHTRLICRKIKILYNM